MDSTRISSVIPGSNTLVYYGYPVPELAEECNLEEVAWLLWHGELPSAHELAMFQADGRSRRVLGADLIEVIKKAPRAAHPMDLLRTAVSFLGMEDTAPERQDAAANLDRSISLMAKIPLMLGTFYRVRKNLEVVPPRGDLGFAQNFFYMCLGKVPPPEVVRAFEASLILYAEHGFNASTFTARVTVSTLSDIYSGVTAGISSLKGPLHGGANEAVMNMLLEIAEPERAREWLMAALAAKRKIMGFGHRVYKRGDSRCPTMLKYARHMAELTGQTKWLDICQVLADTMLKEKCIYPNLDFYSGPAYYLMGLDIDMFTPIFVMARVVGWTAHIVEQLADNRLIRPLSHYTGPAEHRVVPLTHRIAA